MADSGSYDQATLLRRRAAAEAMMKAPDKPITHWAQGLAQMANAGIGGYQLAKLDAEDRQRQNGDRLELARMLGMPTPAGGDIRGDSGAAKVASAMGWDFPGNSGSPVKSGRVAGAGGSTAQNAPVSPAANPMGNVGSAMASSPDASLPRGYRNFNPGNIEDGPFARSQPGYAGSDGRFAKFASMDNGTAAMGTLLDSYGKRGINTVNGIINRWAPSSDGNNVNAYAAAVSKHLGIGPDDPIPPEMKPRLITAMALHENGRPMPQGTTAAAPATAPQGGGILSSATPEQRQMIAAGLSASPGSTAHKIAMGMMTGLMGKSPLDAQIKAAQLEKLNLGNAAARDGKTEYGLSPIFGTGPNGETVIGVPGKDGTFKRLDTGPDFKIGSGVEKVDLGTSYQLRDKRTGAIIGVEPKDLKGAEAQKALGKAQGGMQATLPGDIQNAESTLSQIDQLIKHPGLSSIVGLLDQFRPNWMMGASGRDALARFNQLKGKAFLQAYSTLRGGGQITEVEGAKAENAMARMDRAQSEADFTTALTDFRDAVKTGMDKLREKAGIASSAPQAVPSQTAPVTINGYRIEAVD